MILEYYEAFWRISVGVKRKISTFQNIIHERPEENHFHCERIAPFTGDVVCATCVCLLLKIALSTKLNEIPRHPYALEKYRLFLANIRTACKQAGKVTYSLNTAWREIDGH